MPVFDLTHTLSSQTPAYPGTPEPHIAPFATIKSDGYRELSLKLATHSGTHMDAPAHMREHGAFLDALPLTSFMGTGLVIDARIADNSALSADLVSASVKADFILFRTGWDRYWETAAYFESFPYFSSALAEKLAGMPIKGVGIDGPSVDVRDSLDFEAHHALLGNGKLILENLTGLSSLLNQSFMLYAFPLKIRQADGAPVRAVAITEDAI